jgi:uncharacterized protein
MKIFYHSADLDGHCSGAILKNAFPLSELIGIDYGQPFPWDVVETGEKVYMADFSLQPFADMLRLNELCDLTWIDHHKSAILDWEEHRRPVRYTVLSTEQSACELCWMHLFHDEQMPLAVLWLGRYDIWKHKEHPGALEFQYGMRLHTTWPDNQEFWQRLFTDEAFTLSIREQGASLLAYEKTQNAKFIAAYGFVTELDGLRIIAANKGMSNSLLFESVWNPDMYDAMLMFAWKHGQWTVSLYTDKPGVDVSVIAKARGGGGHKGAAGFQCDTLPFLPAKTSEPEP